MEAKKKSIRSHRERVVGFFYVFVLFFVVFVVCCRILSVFFSDNRNETRKEFVIAKMERMRAYRSIQTGEEIIIDSIFNKIKNFSPDVNASYEENDIKFYLNDVTKIYDDKGYDVRYKIFQQIPAFYNMWFADKKELWSKRRNIQNFKKNLEECQIGIQTKTDELKNKGK